ncbi:MAG: hypothetical protein V9E98_00010 [Candidatus Nanopelagicales bacterium]
MTDDAFYHRVYRRIQWMLNVIEPYPTPGRRVTRTERETLLANLDPQTVAHRVKRVQHVTDSPVGGIRAARPARCSCPAGTGTCASTRRWYAPGGNAGHPKPKPNKDSSDDKMSPETVAGWYVRQDPTTNRNESYFGYEAHLAVMTASDPGQPADFPLLVLAMTVDKPAQNIGENATTLLQSLNERGHPAGTLAADRAYLPGAKPEKLQLPARALGYTLCSDYRDDQLGIQAEYGGAILVEGNWYCPSMPQPLIDATIDRPRTHHRPTTCTTPVSRNAPATRSGPNTPPPRTGTPPGCAPPAAPAPPPPAPSPRPPAPR